MPDTVNAQDHVKPFVYETLTTKALHFSISEIQSRMQTLKPLALDLEYTRTMMGFLLFNGRPDTIGMIGLGGGSLAKFCHANLPQARIDVVEINPHVIALRDMFHVPPDDARFAVRRGDGADYVRSVPHPLDVLMVDGYDTEGIPPALCSQRFYDDTRGSLQADGLLVANLHMGHCDYMLHIGRIRRAFDDHVLIVGDRNCGNCIVFACNGQRLQHYRPSPQRRPRHFDLAAWRELAPNLAQVAAEFEKTTSERTMEAVRTGR
ncbi:MAG: transferase [Burkholderiales bacterium]|nr:transferase [Burkholderiales bacterium]